MKKPPTKLYKKRPHIPKGTPLPYTCEVELENGVKATFTQCPVRYMEKSKQYTLDKKPPSK